MIQFLNILSLVLLQKNEISINYDARNKLLR
jgi:hypothetical protein